MAVIQRLVQDSQLTVRLTERVRLGGSQTTWISSAEGGEPAK